MRVQIPLKRRVVRVLGIFTVTMGTFISANTAPLQQPTPAKDGVGGLLLLLQMVPVMQSVDQLGRSAVESLFATCSQCKVQQIQLECLIGWLCADNARDELSRFKALVSTLNTGAIKAFIATTANAKQIECMTCRSFHSWQ